MLSKTCKVWKEDNRLYIRCDCQHGTTTETGELKGKAINIDVTDLMKTKCFYCQTEYIEITPNKIWVARSATNK